MKQNEKKLPTVIICLNDVNEKDARFMRQYFYSLFGKICDVCIVSASSFNFLDPQNLTLEEQFNFLKNQNVQNLEGDLEGDDVGY